MGWIPCSGKSNSKTKTKKERKNTIELQEKPLDQIKPTSGTSSFRSVSILCECDPFVFNLTSAQSVMLFIGFAWLSICCCFKLSRNLYISY